MKEAFAYEHRVGFYEADAAGIVHFARFPLWVEAAETAFWGAHGVELPALGEGKLRGCPKVDFAIRYRRPARFGDTVTLRLLPERVTGVADWRWRFTVQCGEKLLAEGEMGVVFATVSLGEGNLTKALPSEKMAKVLAEYGVK